MHGPNGHTHSLSNPRFLYSCLICGVARLGKSDDGSRFACRTLAACSTLIILGLVCLIGRP
jgi:hypothetical protein